MKILPALLVSVLCGSACFAQSKADSVKAVAIFTKSKDAYAHLKTYIDSGRISNVSSDGHALKDLVFKTAYNGTTFNFESHRVNDANSAYTLNRTGNVINSWPVIANQDKPRNFAYNAMAAVGTSGSTSYIVPGFLFPAEFQKYNFYATLTGISIVGSEKINGKDCFKIIGKRRKDSATIWIAKQDYLIRKIETEIKIDPAQTITDTRNDVAYRKAKGMDYSAAEQALKNLIMIHRLDSLRGHPKRSYVTKDSYAYYPVANGKVNAELLKFKPNK